MQKTQTLLEQVQQNIFDYTKLNPDIFPKEVIAVAPKISKGEKYLGLPWLMLDYPRCFEKENIFAIRTMFWWGHFFSTTLHLSGNYRRKYANKITDVYDELCEHEFYVCIHEQQWHHHLEAGNYSPVKRFSADAFAHHVEKAAFIKLAQKLSFSEWNNAVTTLSENFVRISRWFG